MAIKERHDRSKRAAWQKLISFSALCYIALHRDSEHRQSDTVLILEKPTLTKPCTVYFAIPPSYYVRISFSFSLSFSPFVLYILPTYTVIQCVQRNVVCSCKRSSSGKNTINHFARPVTTPFAVCSLSRS